MTAPVPKNHVIAHSKIPTKPSFVCFCSHHLEPCMVCSFLTFREEFIRKN